ncbi:MAG: hypothetical protein U0R19_02815 [Bryobacteraceae bacterium]
MPAYFDNPGFGSKRSSWLGPPSMNMKMTFFAFAGKLRLARHHAAGFRKAGQPARRPTFPPRIV